MEYELYHHGILGMKWGIRRYQNPDGSLTPAGKKRYLKADGDRIYKDLKKQVRNKRAEMYGNTYRRFAYKGIGENSKKLIEENERNRQEWQNTREFKDWEKRCDSFEKEAWKKVEDGRMTDEEYSKKWDELMSQRPKQNFRDVVPVDGAKLVKGRWEFEGDYINRGGADLTKAYLKDLGYDKETVDLFLKKMLASKRTLGWIV